MLVDRGCFDRRASSRLLHSITAHPRSCGRLMTLRTHYFSFEMKELVRNALVARFRLTDPIEQLLSSGTFQQQASS